MGLSGDRKPDFESIDVEGATLHFNEALTTTPISRPASPSGIITEVLIDVLDDQDEDDGHALVSFDGGTTFKRLLIGGHLVWSVKGRVQQLVFKSSSNTINVEILMNRENP